MVFLYRQAVQRSIVLMEYIVGKEKDMASCISNTSLFMKWLPAGKNKYYACGRQQRISGTNTHRHVQIGTYREQQLSCFTKSM